MILIISSENDTSTNHIIDWLVHFDADFIRINGEDRFTLVSFELSYNCFECILMNVKSGDLLDLRKITAVWYRRGDISFLTNTEHHDEIGEVLAFIKAEYEILHSYIMSYIETLPRLDSYFRRTVNKLLVLSTAKAMGLLIPATYLFERKWPNYLFESYITKSVSEVFSMETSEGYYSGPTTLIDASNIQHYEYSYSLSLLQTHIVKECDVRIFYLRGIFYSMAIMSQNNEKSKVDFRYYPTDPPNRSFPIQLPRTIENNLTNLMSALNLNSGSIDMILDINGRFIFIEVNPIGQFGMTSGPCNYYLEREIACDIIKCSSK